MTLTVITDWNQNEYDDSTIVRIPSDLTSPLDLFSSVKNQLGLPEYFGGNWDAFSECLRDLSWVHSQTIVLLHDHRTFRDDQMWRTYLGILKECIDDWRGDEKHSIVAIFPEECREEVKSLIA